MRPAHRRTWSAAVGLASVALLAAAVPATASAHDGPGVTITTVSNPRPDLVSGPDVLVRLTAPGSVVLRADGQPVEGLTRQADGSFLGLVRGLRPGVHHLVAESGRRQAVVMVIDHAASGPVFSGPQQQPFYCETTAFGLAPAAGPSCAAPTVVSYQYRSTGGAFRALTDPDDRPADLATAKVDGRAVPYVVRIETGTIDRAVYQTAALYDGHEPSPLRPDTSWNRRLVYSFGGGCNGGHHQGSSTGDVLDDLFLSQGDAVASSSLNVLENNCSTIISAEAAMMVKEHFITTYGPVAHTIGWGGSGDRSSSTTSPTPTPASWTASSPASPSPIPSRCSTSPETAGCSTGTSRSPASRSPPPNGRRWPDSSTTTAAPPGTTATPAGSPRPAAATRGSPPTTTPRSRHRRSTTPSPTPAASTAASPNSTPTSSAATRRPVSSAASPTTRVSNTD